MASLAVERRMRGSLYADDPLVRLYDALCEHDTGATGVVTAAEFDDAVRRSGLILGSEEADKLMNQINVADGKVDFWRWAEDVESMLNAQLTRSKLTRGARNTDGNDAALTLYKDRALKQKDFILGQKEKIYRAFCHFEANMITESEFVNFLFDCGVDDTPELQLILKRRNTDGSMSFAELIGACVLPGKELTRTDCQKNNQPIVWESQSRPTDVVAWKNHPPENRTGRAMNRNMVRYEPSGPTAGDRGDINVRELGVEDRIQQERLYATIRDFTAQRSSAAAFRAALRDLRITPSQDLELLIARQESEGSVKFGQFLRCLNMQPLYKLDTVVDPTGVSSAELSHGDLVGWRYENDAGALTSNSPHKTRRHVPPPHQNDNFLYWGNDDAEPIPAGTHKRRVDHRGEHSDLIACVQQHPPEPQPRPSPRRMLSTAQDDHGDIVGWNDAKESVGGEAGTLSGRRRGFQRMQQDHDVFGAAAEAEATIPEPAVKDWRAQSLSTRPW